MAAPQTYQAPVQPVKKDVGQGILQVTRNAGPCVAIQKPFLTVKQAPNTPMSNFQSGRQFIVTIGERNGNNNVYSIQKNSTSKVYQPHFSDQSVQQSVFSASDSEMVKIEAATYCEQVTSTSTSDLSALQGQVFSHQGRSYVVHAPGLEIENHAVSTAPRAPPATVQWLLDNYEAERGSSLPRSTLYSHYCYHCRETNIEPMNAASFGKLIRSVFPGLQTRRLGTRGNSKYHYDGVRVKASSLLSEATKYNHFDCVNVHCHDADLPHQMVSGSENSQSSHSASDLSGLNKDQQFLGDASAAVPNFGNIELGSEELPEGVSLECLSAYESLYLQNCESILHVVVNLQFPTVEALWSSFWRTGQNKVNIIELETVLPKEVLYEMSAMPCVIRYTWESDLAFYQALIEVLIPDVLRPIPSSLTQVIRNFGKNLESCLRTTLQGVPESMIETKVRAVRAFASLLRQYTSLNHLAQAARSVFQNGEQVKQMITDFNKINFDCILDQASFAIPCEYEVACRFEADFKQALESQHSLDQWAEWLEEVVGQLLLQNDRSSSTFVSAARSAVLIWSYYSGLVIRDLTLRSASSFGSFHLMNILFGDYILYLILHKVAAANHTTPVAIYAKEETVRPLIFESSNTMNSALVKEEVIIADIKPDPSPSPPLQYSELVDASELPSSSQPCQSESSLSSTADQTISKGGTTTAEAHHYKTVYVIPTKRPAPSDLSIAVKRVTTN